MLAGWGYRRCGHELTAVVCTVLLLNRSPLLEDLSASKLTRLRANPAMGPHFPGDLHGIHRAVAALGHAEPPPAPKYGDGPAVITGAPAPWVQWVERWYSTSALEPGICGIHRVVLAKMGHWLAAEHPGITDPAPWNRETCAAWPVLQRQGTNDAVGAASLARHRSPEATQHYARITPNTLSKAYTEAAPNSYSASDTRVHVKVALRVKSLGRVGSVRLTGLTGRVVGRDQPRWARW